MHMVEEHRLYSERIVSMLKPYGVPIPDQSQIDQWYLMGVAPAEIFRAVIHKKAIR